MRAFPTVLLAAAAAVQGPCAGPSSPTQQSVPPTAAAPVASGPITHLLTEQNSGYAEEAELVVRDAAAWERAWRGVHGGVPGNTPPAVDFARDMVVLVATGQRNTGGYAVRVTDVAPAGGGAVVRYTVTEPGAGCMTSQALTAPVDVVRAPRAAGEVRFERRVVKEAC